MNSNWAFDIDREYERLLDRLCILAEDNLLDDSTIIGAVRARVGTDAADALSNWLKEDED